MARREKAVVAVDEGQRPALAWTEDKAKPISSADWLGEPLLIFSPGKRGFGWVSGAVSRNCGPARFLSPTIAIPDVDELLDRLRLQVYDIVPAWFCAGVCL